MLQTFRRVVVCCNDEPESLQVLPPMDSDLLDKVTLFRCQRAEVGPNRPENRRRLTECLPAFLHWALSLRIPDALKSDRFGVKAYHDPELLGLLAEQSPEAKLLEMIDEVIFPPSKEKDWEVCRHTAEELKARLTASQFSSTASKLLDWTGATGSLLQRLAGRFPDRFERKKSGNRITWRIGCPEKE